MEITSRVAAFQQNKRPHDRAIGDDNSSSDSMPRKRARRTGKLGHQDVGDFVPFGASFTSNPMLFDHGLHGENESAQNDDFNQSGDLQGHETNVQTTAQRQSGEQPGNTASEDTGTRGNIPRVTNNREAERRASRNPEDLPNNASMKKNALSEKGPCLKVETNVVREPQAAVSTTNGQSKSEITTLSWNPVKKLKVRTSLSGGLHKGEDICGEQTPTDDNSGEAQEKGW